MDSDAADRLREAAKIIRDKAAELASWSARIPASLEISEDDYSVTIRANPEIAPQARAFEIPVRHPLNYPAQRDSKKGHAWARTPHRSFLEKAVDETSDDVVQKCAQVVDDWTYKLGYKKD